MEEAKRTRRRHSAEFKQQILAECAQPGASVAGVALAHRINANLVQKWRRKARGDDRGGRPVGATFIPGTLATSAPCSVLAATIHVEVQRAAVSARIQWPVAAAAECAAWLRDWLK